MRDMEKIFRYKAFKWIVIAAVLSTAQSIRADEIINYSNCMQHIGGGGLGDFDCYEEHTRQLEADNSQISDAIELVHGVTTANKVKLRKYMLAQNAAAKACDLSITLEYPSRKERMRRNHIELYDVMAARCRYSIRNQQNEFLKDLLSITN